MAEREEPTAVERFPLPPPRFPTVVHDILSVLVVTVVMASPLVLTNRCGKTRKDTTRKDHEKYLRSLKYDVTPAPNGANWLVLPFFVAHSDAWNSGAWWVSAGAAGTATAARNGGGSRGLSLSYGSQLVCSNIRVV